MTTNNTGDPTKAGTLAQNIVAILINEDSVTRQRAIHAALMLLGETSPQRHNDQSTFSPSGAGPVDQDHNSDLAAFFKRDDDMKPADHAQLCAAYHYSQYGAVPFSMAELKAIATDAAVVLPDRADMTLRNAQHKGKKLFQTSGAGSFKPTAAACLHFADKWKVKPGRKVKPVASGKGAKDADD